MKVRPAYSRRRIADAVTRMGRAINRDFAGRTIDVVVILENAFIFGADLVRQIRRPVVCHFVRSEIRDVEMGGYNRREVFFSHHPSLAGRDVLLVDALLNSGVTQDFLVKRLQDARPRSLRLAVLFDRPQNRRVDLNPDYLGFPAASKYLVGYGLPGARGTHRNLPDVAFSAAPPSRSAAARSGGRKRARVHR